MQRGLVFAVGVNGQPSGPAKVLRRAEQLCQPPIEDHDLAEIAEYDVLPLKVAVDDAARVGIGNGVTGGDEGIDQGTEGQRRRLAFAAVPVIVANGIDEGPPANKAHRIERLSSGVGANQLIDGDNARVFELPGDLRLREEACAIRDGPVVVPQFLKSDVTAQVRHRAPATLGRCRPRRATSGGRSVRDDRVHRA